MNNNNSRFSAFLNKEIVRNSLTLVTGTSIAQAIPIAVMPVLTRLYTPEEFGVFALYISIISVFGVIATARYELAIMLPDRDLDAASIALLAASISIAISAVILLFIWFTEAQLVAFLGNPDITPWLYLAPFSVAVIGIYQAVAAWATRKKRFHNLTLSRVTESGSASASQAAFSQIILTGGLIIGSVLGKLLACGVLLRNIWNRDKSVFQRSNKHLMLDNARKYIAFPKYSVGGAFFDTAAQQLPILLITRFFSAATTGHFSLTFRVLSLPITFVSSALSQVLFQRVAVLQRERPEHLPGFIVGVFLLLFLLISPIIPLLWFYGEALFRFVFGEQWAPAGQMASVLAIAVAFRFAISPLSGVLALEHNVRIGVFWQVLYFFTMLATLLYFSNHAIETFVLAFVVHEVVLYSFYLALILIRTNANAVQH